MIHTKMMIPTVGDHLIHRSILIDKIEKGIAQGFVLVSCPPGYGKTTLIADWAQQSKTPVAWLKLDDQDNHLSILIQYLQVITEDFTTQKPVSPDKFILQDGTFETFLELITTLINRCTQMSADFTLVLDDYHLIHNPKIHEGLTFLLDHFPPHLRLIIATRQDPPFSLGRLRANQRIKELRFSDLQFSLSETEIFLNQIRQLNLSESEIKQFHQQTEGWITGLQLASLTYSNNRSLQSPNLLISSDASLTLEYLVDEVLSRQPVQVQDFLLRTSILDNLYGPLCDYVIGKKAGNSQELLHTLYHSNLFLSTLDQNEHWFRYHSLFSGVLRHLLAEKHPDEIVNLYVRASDWCDQNGYFEEALNYAEKSKEDAIELSLIEKYSLEAIQQGNIIDIVYRIKRIDEKLLSTSPVLCLVLTWGYILSIDLDLSEIWLEKSCALLEDPGIDEKYKNIEKPLRGIIAASKSMLAAARGDVNRAMLESAQALDLLPSENSFTHSFALFNKGLILSINGKMDQAVSFLLEAINSSQKSENRIIMIIARSNLGELLIYQGQLSQALTLFQQSLQTLHTQQDKISWFEGFLYKEIGAVFQARNQLKEASQYMNKCLEIAHIYPSLLDDLDTHIRLAHLYFCQDDFDNSKKEITKARQLVVISQSGLDDLIVEMNDAKLSLLRKQVAPALKWAQKKGFYENKSNEELQCLPFLIRIEVQILLARIHLVQAIQNHDSEKFTLSTEILNSLLPKLAEEHLVERQIEVYILLALIYHELGYTGDLIVNLDQALTLAEPEEIRQVFLNEGIPMARILTRYLAYLKQTKKNDGGALKDFAADLLFRLTGKVVESEKSEPQNEPGIDKDTLIIELLTARETEILQLVARGRSNNEIAVDLHISINTVKRHLNNVFMKLGVSTRTQAIRVAQQQGLIK